MFRKTSLIFAVTAIFLTGTAHAAVVWTFEEVGSDVVATASGSFDNDMLSASNGTATLSNTDASGFRGLSGAFNRGATSGSTNYIALAANPSSHTGTFGSHSGTLYWGPTIGTLSAGTDVSTLNATLTWNSTTIAALFVNYPSVPTLASPHVNWTSNADSNDTISLVTAPPSPAPEPASLTLIVVGLVGICTTRRRQRQAAS